MSKIIIYTDGSFTPKCIGYSGWAFIVLDSNEEEIIHKDFGKIECESRNIDGECYAVIKALEWITKNIEDKYKTIKIFYDYEGIHKWISGEWKTNKKVSINYRSIVNEFIHQLYPTNIEWIKVKSHSNNKWNDEVDKLCKKSLII
jgi:ribonuclease HI